MPLGRRWNRFVRVKRLIVNTFTSNPGEVLLYYGDCAAKSHRFVSRLNEVGS